MLLNLYSVSLPGSVGPAMLGWSEVTIIALVVVFLTVMVMLVGIVISILSRRRTTKFRGSPKPPPELPSCPKCGTPLGADAPGGLCPKCMMAAGLETDRRQSSKQSFSSGQDEPPSPEDIAEHFPQLEMLELIGRGGMGIVYQVRQTSLDRLAALKVLPADASRDPAFAGRFEREARTLAKLNHPNIVTVYDFGESGGWFYLLMEYVDGANLRSLKRAQQISPRDALQMIPRICEALQYAHDRGVVHRDIKPENVLVDREGRVKIADFGIAKLMDQEGDATWTATRHGVGTPHYMAPEQIEQPETVDHRADIFALGVVFYELLTGELPLGRFDPPSRRVEVDVRVDEVVLKSLERDRERRYQTASAMGTDTGSITR